MRLYTMFKKQWETELNERRIKSAEFRIAASKKVSAPKKTSETPKNKNPSKGPERLQYQDSSDEDSD